MHPLRLTLKNYRCFADEAPLTIELREGFTALVGPNNSGKSTVLRFVHEMRQLWKYLAGSGSPLVEAFRGNSFGINYRDVVDPEELFCNANARDLTFAIELLEVKQEIASEMTLPILGVMGRAARQEPNLWQITLLDGHQPSLLAHNPANSPRFDQSAERFIVEWDGRQFDFSALSQTAKDLSACLFIPAFRNAINQGSGEYYGMDSRK